ncbi:hypothetical protein VTK26DRAFT_5723 [Humicola hyalothermophila]
MPSTTLTLTRALLLLLPLSGYALAQNAGPNDVIRQDKGGEEKAEEDNNDSGNFFSDVGDAISKPFRDLTPEEAIEQFPRCLIPCHQRVAKDMRCKESDLSCLCGGILNLFNPGDSWEEKLKKCNDEANDQVDKDKGEEECDDDDLEIEDLCKGVTGENSADDTRLPVQEMFQKMLDGKLESQQKAKEGEDDDEAGGDQPEDGEKESAAAGGRAAVGSLAAMLGFAVALF